MNNEIKVTDHTEWDESSKEYGTLTNHTVQLQDTLKVSDLTVGQLKQIIRDTVSESTFYQQNVPYVPSYTPWAPPLYNYPNIVCSNNSEVF
jgi:hypothetical protein